VQTQSHGSPVSAVLQKEYIGHGTFGTVVRAAQIGAHPSPDVAIKLLPRGDAVRTCTLQQARQQCMFWADNVPADTCHTVIHAELALRH